MFDMTRSTLEVHSVDLRQFIDFRQATLPNGVRVIDAYNSSGLNFTILPDRGLDIYTAWYNGTPLTWITAGSPQQPDFGMPYLRNLNGGLLFTCGLRHVGPPEKDDITGEQRDIHGDYSRLRAYDITTRGVWEGDSYVAEVSGRVSEGRLFGEQLRLTRTIRMRLGDPALEVIDVIENHHDLPTPLMLLHHFNFGYPVVQEGVRLYTTSDSIHPRDEPARAHAHEWDRYHNAAPNHAEEVFFHQVRAGTDKIAMAALASDNFGIQLAWDTTYEPILCQWRNFRRGVYICGVEPCNSVPEGQNFSRKMNRLVMLQPGEQQTFKNRLSVLPNAQAVARSREQIAHVKATGTVVQVNLEGYAAI